MLRIIDISDIYLDQTGEPSHAKAIIESGILDGVIVDGLRMSRDWALQVLGVDAVWQVERYEFAA